MSKLAEQMRRAARTEARPVGFTTAASTARQTMLVVAEVEAAAAATLTATAADALLLSEDATEQGMAAAVALGMPVGVRLARAGRARVQALKAAGVDFVVLGDESAASALMEDDLSYILDVAGEPTDTELRTMDSLPVEALLVSPVSGAVTIKRSVGLRRFVAFARKPLMMPLSGGADAADLEALRELNVLLLLTPAAEAPSLRTLVSGLPPRRRRREESTVGVGGLMLGSARVEAPDDEPDDE